MELVTVASFAQMAGLTRRELEMWHELGYCPKRVTGETGQEMYRLEEAIRFSVQRRKDNDREYRPRWTAKQLAKACWIKEGTIKAWRKRGHGPLAYQQSARKFFYDHYECVVFAAWYRYRRHTYRKYYSEHPGQHWTVPPWPRLNFNGLSGTVNSTLVGEIPYNPQDPKYKNQEVV